MRLVLSQWTVVTPLGDYRFTRKHPRGQSHAREPFEVQAVVFFARREIECLDPDAVQGALELCDDCSYGRSNYRDGIDRWRAAELARDFEWRALTGQFAVEEVRRVVLRQVRREPAPAQAPARQISELATGESNTAPPKAPEKTWIQFLLLDKKGDPVAGQPYRIKLPDGSTREGATDERGLASIEQIDPGECEFSFTQLAHDAWGPA